MSDQEMDEATLLRSVWPDPEREEASLRSLFGDGIIMMPTHRSVEGYTLFAILENIGVEIFNRVFATTKEVFCKGFQGFRSSNMSFLVGFGDMSAEIGELDGEFKITVEIRDRRYGQSPECRGERWLIFKLYEKESPTDWQSDWLPVGRFDSDRYTPLRESFMKLKEALLAELSK
jgi:hypothetical protein